MKRIFFLLLLPMLFFADAAFSQDGNNPANYANLALQFSSQQFNGDAATGIMPSVASVNGYGSFIDNPASIAFIDNNYFSFGLTNNQVEYDNTYLGNSINTTDNTTKLGNVGFIYKVPTEQGSFVLGGGFNRVSYQNGLHRLSARNDESTITDVFKDPGSDYHDIAYNAYAIDWGDVDSTYMESIFRIGFENYPGITQEGKISHETNINEYSFFFGTEFQKDFYVGISGGLTAGSHTYRRDFLELDDRGDYDYNFIRSPDSGEDTDIHSILVTDELDSDIIGFSIRAGMIYQITPKLNAGLSYLLPSTIIVREGYFSSIDTEFDDGSTPSRVYDTSFASNEDFEYRIKKPGQLNVGLALLDIGKFDISASAELIDYANLRMDFITGNDLNFDEEVILSDQQEQLDDFMSDNYSMVINGKAGITYTLNEQFTLKAGYAYFPGKSKLFEADRNVIAAGFTANLTKSILFDVNGQYSFWDDRSVAYTYYDGQANVNRAEVIDQKANSLKITAGIRFLFN